VEQLSVERS